MKTLTRLTIILLIALLTPVSAYPQITGTQQQIEKLKKEKEKNEREQREAEAAARKKREAEAAARKRREAEAAARKKREAEAAAQKKRDAEAAAQRKKREAAEAERKEKERKAAIEKQRKEQQRLREENRRLREEIAHRDSVEKARLAKEKEERQEAERKKRETAARKKREAEEAARAPKTFTVNGVSFTMIPVQGGTFTMGATAEQGSDADSDEKPAHRVTLSSYMIGQTEVTQELWEAVMGSNPSINKGYNHPVEMVSWNDCQTFISRLNSMTGKNFRLPTEAEWEFAARGGNSSRGYKYSGLNDINAVAWYTNNSGDYTHAVATKNPNELDIYDMSGNVWEWCQDWYGNYSSSSQTNPTGAPSGSYRVNRGGSAWNDARYCRVSIRDYSSPGGYGNSLGLRLCL